jgi:hypothetical protein
VSTGVDQFYSQATSASRSGQQTSKGRRRGVQMCSRTLRVTRADCSHFLRSYVYKGPTGAAFGASPDLKDEKDAQPSEQGKIIGTLGSKRIMHAALSRRSDSLSAPC